eukprot:1365536-Amorphochlora_amoeboformis.AAC.2
MKTYQTQNLLLQRKQAKIWARCVEDACVVSSEPNILSQIRSSIENVHKQHGHHDPNFCIKFSSSYPPPPICGIQSSKRCSSVDWEPADVIEGCTEPCDVICRDKASYTQSRAEHTIKGLGIQSYGEL